MYVCKYIYIVPIYVRMYLRAFIFYILVYFRKNLLGHVEPFCVPMYPPGQHFVEQHNGLSRGALNRPETCKIFFVLKITMGHARKVFPLYATVRRVDDIILISSSISHRITRIYVYNYCLVFLLLIQRDLCVRPRR